VQRIENKMLPDGIIEISENTDNERNKLTGHQLKTIERETKGTVAAASVNKAMN
jgi:hypothetical protein